MVDTESVGQIIYTKSINSDKPENLTQVYKYKKSKTGEIYIKSGQSVYEMSMQNFLSPVRASSSQLCKKLNLVWLVYI